MTRLIPLLLLAALLYFVFQFAPAPVDWEGLSEHEWRQRLTPEEFEVLREGATEDAYSGELYTEERVGSYSCAGCHSVLFLSGSKFHSGTGWPSFDDPEAEAVVHRRHSTALGVAVEVRCSTCKGHLGHVFPDGPTTTGNRYCINSLALKFEPEKSEGNAAAE